MLRAKTQEELKQSDKMDSTFYCEGCKEDIDIQFINHHREFCELMSNLSQQEIDELLKQMQIGF